MATLSTNAGSSEPFMQRGRQKDVEAGAAGRSAVHPHPGNLNFSLTVL